jgi:hypothetical protein
MTTFPDSQDDDADASDEALTGVDAAEDADPDSDVASVDSEWSLAQHHRLLMRILLDAIAAHIDSEDLVPSPELEQAMDNVKHELWS